MFGLKIFGPIILIIVVIAGWKYWDLKSTITKYENDITNRNEQIVVLKTDLQTERGNVILLKNNIADMNNQIDNLKVKQQNTQKAFDAFKKKSTDEKYSGTALDIMKLDVKKCEDGLLLNKMISELTYEEI